MKTPKYWTFIGWSLVAIAVVLVGYFIEPTNKLTVDQADLAQLQKMASSGEARAQLMLGLAYQNGEYGLTPDSEKARQILTEAANNGSQYAAGLLKENTNKVSPPTVTRVQQPSVIEHVWGHYRDFSLFVASIFLLIVYQLHLRSYAKSQSLITVRQVTMKARTSWVKTVMEGSKDIVAVQTLRNSTMAATFLASTAILLIIGILNITHFGMLSNTGNHAVSILHAFKTAPLLISLFTAFFMFTLSIRMFNHVGYLINCKDEEITAEFVSHTLNRGGDYYSIGMRSYYLSIPFICWLFNPLLMFISTAALLFVLYHIDHMDFERG